MSHSEEEEVPLSDQQQPATKVTSTRLPQEVNESQAQDPQQMTSVPMEMMLETQRMLLEQNKAAMEQNKQLAEIIAKKATESATAVESTKTVMDKAVKAEVAKTQPHRLFNDVLETTWEADGKKTDDDRIQSLVHKARSGTLCPMLMIMAVYNDKNLAEQGLGGTSALLDMWARHSGDLCQFYKEHNFRMVGLNKEQNLLTIYGEVIMTLPTPLFPFYPQFQEFNEAIISQWKEYKQTKGGSPQDFAPSMYKTRSPNNLLTAGEYVVPVQQVHGQHAVDLTAVEQSFIQLQQHVGSLNHQLQDLQATTARYMSVPPPQATAQVQQFTPPRQKVKAKPHYDNAPRGRANFSRGRGGRQGQGHYGRQPLGGEEHQDLVRTPPPSRSGRPDQPMDF